jgi:type I restriction enzyme S subunit
MKFVKFSQILDFQKKSQMKAGEGLANGTFPFFTSSSTLSKYTEFAQFTSPSIIFGTGGSASVHVCDQPFSVSTDCLVAQIKPELSKKFVIKFIYYYLFKNIWILEKGFKGAGLKHISKSYINDISIPEFSLEDQKRIVKILDATDALRQKRKQAIALLDDYLKSVFLEMFGDPVTNSKGWKLQAFESLGTLDRGKSKHRPRNAPDLLGGSHPLIQTGDIANANLFIEEYKSTYSDFGLKQSKKWPKGTLCITIAANIAKTGILNFDACFPDSVVGFVANTKKTNNKFIHFWMSFFQKILESNAPESAQKNINLKILRCLKVINPPLEMQNRFAEIVEKTESIKQKMLIQSQELETQFQALMQKAFKGGL